MLIDVRLHIQNMNACRRRWELGPTFWITVEIITIKGHYDISQVRATMLNYCLFSQCHKMVYTVY
jgi:hypothetical protein